MILEYIGNPVLFQWTGTQSPWWWVWQSTHVQCCTWTGCPKRQKCNFWMQSTSWASLQMAIYVRLQRRFFGWVPKFQEFFKWFSCSWWAWNVCLLAHLFKKILFLWHSPRMRFHVARLDVCVDMISQLQQGEPCFPKYGLCGWCRCDIQHEATQLDTIMVMWNHVCRHCWISDQLVSGSVHGQWWNAWCT